MNRRVGAIVIVVVLVVLALVAARAFEERNRRLASGQSGKPLDDDRKKLGEVPLWRQR